MTTTLVREEAGLVPAPEIVHRSPVYYPALDGLRAVAFLMVFGDHYLALPWGFTGVDCFFVLSGFLITGILYDTRNDARRARNFFVRRSLRIFPLYYGLIALLLLSDPIFRWRWTAEWFAWPAYLGNFLRFHYSSLPGAARQLGADAQLGSRVFPHCLLYFGHFWSLCIEEQFYLLWPWIVWRVRDRRRLIWICAASLLVCPLLRWELNRMLPPLLRHAEVLYRTTALRVDALLLGGLIALLRRGSNSARLSPIAQVAFPALLCFIGLWHLAHPRLWGSMHNAVYPGYVFTWALSLADLFFASVLVLLLDARSYLHKLFDVRPLRWLGRVSYGAYVFHDIFHAPLRAFAEPRFAHWRIVSSLAAFALTLALAAASYRWIETPLLRRKSRWINRPEADAPIANCLPDRSFAKT